MVNQLKGMPCKRYEVGVLRNRDTPEAQMLRREWTKTEILKSLSWLKRENAKGAEIFIRPKDPSWILVDDVKRETVEWMNKSGVKPSVVLETSPRNYQAWVKVSKEEIEKETATLVARRLAHGLKADRNSADWRHLGRLAGFTNRKEEHQRADGKQPFVKLHYHKPRYARWGNRLVMDARCDLKWIALAKAAKKEKEEEKRGRGVKEKGYPYYARKMGDLPEKKNGKVDWSRVDYRVARDMVRDGKEPEDIKRQIKKHSPELANRKGQGIHQYVERTVEGAAMSIAQLMFQSQGQEKQPDWKEESKDKDKDDDFVLSLLF